MTVHIEAEFARDVEQPVVGILIRNRLGFEVYGTNTRVEGVELERIAAGETLEIDFAMDCSLTRQDYTVTVATQHLDGSSQDWLDDAIQFTVLDSRDLAGVADLKTAIVWSRHPAGVAQRG